MSELNSKNKKHVSVKKFYKYQAGKEFLLRTDHKALLWLVDKHTTSARLSRWALELQNYTFKLNM